MGMRGKKKRERERERKETIGGKKEERKEIGMREKVLAFLFSL